MTQLLSTHTAFSDGILKIVGRFRNVVLCTVRDHGLKLQRFEQQFTDRFYDFGFSDGACVIGSAGMTVRGKTPFVCAPAVTLTGRCYEFIRNSVCHSNVNVKFIGTQSGFSLSQDGGSVQTYDDLALMRMLPQMKVFSPSDYWEALRMMEFMASDYGPSYMRLSSFAVPEIYNQSFLFHPEKGSLLRQGDAVTLCATGTMVSVSLQTADFLEKRGISANVVAISTLKPFSLDFMRDVLQKTKHLVVIEEHSVIGGLGSVILEAFSGKIPCFVHRIGLEDCFGESATKEDLYRVSGLVPESIGAKIEKLL